MGLDCLHSFKGFGLRIRDVCMYVCMYGYISIYASSAYIGFVPSSRQWHTHAQTHTHTYTHTHTCLLLAIEAATAILGRHARALVVIDDSDIWAPTTCQEQCACVGVCVCILYTYIHAYTPYTLITPYTLQLPWGTPN